LSLPGLQSRSLSHAPPSSSPQAAQFARDNKRNTVTSREIQMAVRHVFAQVLPATTTSSFFDYFWPRSAQMREHGS
jgi:hypothetical protein